MPRSATVRLRPGITQVALPDHRLAKAGTNYVLRWTDFELIAADHLAEVFQVISINDNPLPIKAGIDLTLNSATLPTGLGWKLGRIERGHGQNDRFMLVKVVDLDVAAGDAVCWASTPGRTVTKDRVGGSAASPLKFAGIALATVTAGHYGWIMVDGWVNVPASVGTVGDPLIVHPTSDGALETYELNSTYSLSVGAASAGTYTLTVGAQTTAALAFDASAATVQTAVAGLSTVGAGNVAVTGTDATTGGGGLTVVFQGALAGTQVALTGAGTGLTGGAFALTETTVGYDLPTPIIGTSLGADGVDIRGTRRLRLSNYSKS